MTPISNPDRWAHLRFSIIGPLLASPPEAGALQEELVKLSKKLWRHPTNGTTVCFAASTIERWYYAAKAEQDPVSVLRRKTRNDRGKQWAISEELAEVLRQQYAEHPTWSYQLHLDNIAVRVKEDPSLGLLPSYASIRRFMRGNDMRKKRRPKGRQLREGQRRARQRLQSREVRSYEAAYVNALWHLDFHHGSRKILTAEGAWETPILLAVLDDHSRLVCHAQWYRQETAESLVHGLVQAFCKRGLPRALMTDNGSAMLAIETTQGLKRLSILHNTTLPYSPHQNGKQEVFWAQVEGRLFAMLEGEPNLTLALLNNATQAWVEMEYQRRTHSETKRPPLDRWLDGKSVARVCPSVDDLRLCFTSAHQRTLRRSDATISVQGTRFEVPIRFRHLRQLHIRYASWDLSHVWLMDEDAGVALQRLYPLDKARNAEGYRRPIEKAVLDEPNPTGVAPLLRSLMTEYAATGLPPAYIAKDDAR